MNSFKKIMAFVFLAGTSLAVWASIPPPPVNQNLGIPDSVFDMLNAGVCINCHGGNPPTGVPVNPAYNPDRHHQHVGTPIAGGPETPPFPDANNDGVPDTNYSCYNCHTITFDPLTGMQELDPTFRDCLTCHEHVNETTVHHATQRAQNGNCFQCHGSLVQGIDVATETGKRPDPLNPGQTIPVDIPTYSTSMITPYRSGKPNADTTITSSAGTHPGNCNFCHNTANGGPQGTPEPFTLANGTTVMLNIFRNMDNHHSTGFFAEQKCTWCHDVFTPSASSIRVCERCHDRLTLHNIEYDAVGDGTQPGLEDAYYGHIGNPDNCWGCHGNDGQVMSMAGTDSPVTSIVPTLSTMSTQSVSSGTTTVISMTGNSFVNTAVIGGVEYTYEAEVQLTDSDGNITLYTPSTLTTNYLEFTVPADLAAGNYMVQIKKAFQFSNPLGLVVKRSVSSQLGYVYSRYGGLVVIAGQNFTEGGLQMVNVQNSGTSIVDQNGVPAQRVYVWRDGLIVAHFASIPSTVTITNVFGDVSVPMSVF